MRNSLYVQSLRGDPFKVSILRLSSYVAFWPSSFLQSLSFSYFHFSLSVQNVCRRPRQVHAPVLFDSPDSVCENDEHFVHIYSYFFWGSGQITVRLSEDFMTQISLFVINAGLSLLYARGLQQSTFKIRNYQGIVIQLLNYFHHGKLCQNFLSGPSSILIRFVMMTRALTLIDFFRHR